MASIQPARLFSAMVHDYTAVPQVFKSTIEVFEGNGGAGTIKHVITFNEGSRFSASKHGVDNENMVYKYSLIDVEGGEKNDSIEYVTYEFKVSASGDGQVSEEMINGQKERGTGMVKAVEAYLAANPRIIYIAMKIAVYV